MHFTQRYRYRFGDIDDAGIAYYPSFFHYFHCAYEDWWSDGLGIAYDRVLHEDKFGLPVVHVECDFRGPIRYGDEPDIHLGILRVGRSSVKFGYWMTREGHDRPLCRAVVTTAGVDMDSMGSRPVPDSLREAFAAFTLAPGEFPD